MTLPPLVYVIDCHALVYIAQAANDMTRARLYARLQTGEIAVPTSVWDDFCNAYEDEAEVISPHITRRVRLLPAHTASASVMATRANSGFRVEPYGNSDWLAGGTATAEDCILLTSPEKKSFYATLLDCAVLDVTEVN